MLSHSKTKRFFFSSILCLSSTSNSCSFNLRQAAARFGLQKTGSSSSFQEKVGKCSLCQMLPVLNEQETTGKDSLTLQKAWFQETQSPLKIESIHWLCEKNNFPDIHGEGKWTRRYLSLLHSWGLEKLGKHRTREFSSLCFKGELEISSRINPSLAK